MSATRRSVSLLALTLAVLTLGAAMAWGDDQEEPKQAKLGEKAPDFTLVDSKGRQHKLADLKGRIVVLEWTDAECPIVRRHYGSTRSMQETYEKVKGLDRTSVWLAINSTFDTNDKKMNFWITQHKIEYPILLDTDGTVGRLYEARLAPQMYVIDKEGVLRYRGAIDDNRSGIEDQENVTNYVVNAVQQLVNGETVLPNETRPYGCSVKYRP